MTEKLEEMLSRLRERLERSRELLSEATQANRMMCSEGGRVEVSDPCAASAYHKPSFFVNGEFGGEVYRELCRKQLHDRLVVLSGVLDDVRSLQHEFQALSIQENLGVSGSAFVEIGHRLIDEREPGGAFPTAKAEPE